MKVKELIKILNEIEMPEAEIIISSDSEGNSFSAFSDWSCGILDSDHQFSDIGWTAEDACLDEEEWEEMINKSPRVICFWP